MDGFERAPQPLHAEAHRMRKLGVEQQELGDAFGAQIRRVDLAISFESGAASQQADPFQLLGARSPARAACEELGEMRSISCAVACTRSMKRPAWMNCQPSPCSHGGIGDALEQMRAFVITV